MVMYKDEGKGEEEGRRGRGEGEGKGKGEYISINGHIFGMILSTFAANFYY